MKKRIKKTLLIGINLGDFGSTGGIMRNSLEYAHRNGNYDYLVIVPKDRGLENTYGYMDNPLNIFQKVLYHKVLKERNRPDGFFETPYTNRIIKRIKIEAKKYKRCFVHLHNIHMANIDLRLLFKYLSKEKNVQQVFYTLHDEWSYSGGCYVHMDNNNHSCNKWQNGCTGKCPNSYEKNNFSCAKQWQLKKGYTLMLKNKLILIVVSKWLKNNALFSFLKDVPIFVNYGETSLDASKINSKKIAQIKNKLNIKNKKIVLAVSAYWNDWKGVNYLYEMADKLPNNFVLLVVGGKIKEHNKIVHVNNVNQDELPNYYSLADVYLSVSQSEALGLTTCEAQMCGTPVVAFGHTAIKETIINGETGYVVGEENDVSKMIDTIIKVVKEKPLKKEDIIKNGNRFKKYEHAKRMIEIYNDYNN